jgi:predicted N-acetyltransferase YhbS
LVRREILVRFSASGCVERAETLMEAGRDVGTTVRKERASDIDAISRLTEAAFRDHPHSNHTEQFIVNALRRCDRLTISLVAVDDDAILGHVALSPVTLSSGVPGWYGLGPISTLPSRQREGIGSMLIDSALAELKRIGAAGCVVLGDRGFYRRFGFKTHRGLELPGVPAEYFQAISFGAEPPVGSVRYHEAFAATA